MNRTKFIAFFSVFGFLFSFLIGLFSRVSVLWLFVRAVIFAVVFFLLAFALYSFYEKFINSDSVDDGFDSSLQSQNLAQKIDLVTPDEPLPVDNNASQFYVGNRHQMLNRDDYFASAQTNDYEVYKNFCYKKGYKPFSENNFFDIKMIFDEWEKEDEFLY